MMNNKQLIKAVDNIQARVLLGGLQTDKPVVEFSAHDYLSSQGFVYSGFCRCSGTQNYKYSKGNYIVYFLPKRKTYHLKFLNNYLIKNEPVATLCPKLKSLGIVNSEYSSAS